MNKLVKNTGNYISIFRIAALMQNKGHTISVISFDDLNKPEKFMQSFKPDLIHTFHAYNSYNIVKLASTLTIPIVLTVTGTDVNADLNHHEKREKTLFCLHNANAVTIFHSAMKELLPKTIKNVKIIPQSVALEKTEKKCPKKFRLLLVANIRPVKCNLFLVKSCEELLKKIPELELVFIGKILDKEYGKKFLQKIKGKNWITYYGEIDHQDIAQYYSCVNIALNTSLSEGGMANSLLEAMYLKIPVIASSIAGNRTIIKHNQRGLLFKNKNEFKKSVLKLYNDKKLRKALTDNAYTFVTTQLTPSTEVQGYIDVYTNVLKARSNKIKKK